MTKLETITKLTKLQKLNRRNRLEDKIKQQDYYVNTERFFDQDNTNEDNSNDNTNENTNERKTTPMKKSQVNSKT